MENDSAAKAVQAKEKKKTVKKAKAVKIIKEMEHCVICDEEFDKKCRNKVECIYCSHAACQACYTEFILGCEEPRCMFPDCKRPWTRKICTESFSQTFMKKTYCELRETRLFHHEQSLLPATQIIVEEYNRISKMLRQSIALQRGYSEYFKVKLARLESEMVILKLAYQKKLYDPETMTDEEIINAATSRILPPDTRDPTFHEKREMQRAEKQYLSDRIKAVNTRIFVCEKNMGIFGTRLNNLVSHIARGVTRFLNPYVRLSIGDEDDEEEGLGNNEGNNEGENGDEIEPRYDTRRSEVKRVFVRACPNNDCRGFLSSQWKCGLCERHTCSKCHVLKDQESPNNNNKDSIKPHVCNPDDVASATLLKKDCKPCPKCAASIFKIDGCDQMWCTMCSTAFSWRSGKLIVSGGLHNPHYFEWMRRQEEGKEGGEKAADRNPMEIRCGRTLNDYHFAQDMRHKLRGHDAPKNLIVKLDYIIFSINFIQRHAAAMQPNAVENNLMLRFRYLTNDLSLPRFKKLVQMANKRFEHKREMRDILITFVQTATDIVYDYYDSLDSDKLAELDRFLDYINFECFPELKATYNTTTLFYIQFRDEDDPFRPILMNVNAKPKK
jgi:hypothetical protein